jgi:hypothetical protein
MCVGEVERQVCEMVVDECYALMFLSFNLARCCFITRKSLYLLLAALHFPPFA